MTGPGWLWGLLPLAALWIAGNLLLDEPIRRDLASRSAAAVEAAAGTVKGSAGIGADADGRDIIVTGEVPNAEAASRGMEALRATFGVRRVLGGLSHIVARKPYDWSVARTSGGVVVAGAVPDEGIARELVALLKEALPGVTVEDRQEIAHGAPEGFGELARTLIARLPRLADGRIALDDRRICIEGTAIDTQAYALLRDTDGLNRDGFSTIECPLLPPRAAPYQWRAERVAAGGVLVTGHHPAPAAQAQIRAALRAAFPEPASIEDRSEPANGAPVAFLALVGRAVADLVRLRDGFVAIEGQDYRVSGSGPADAAACSAFQRSLSESLPVDVTVQVEVACTVIAQPAAPPPPVADSMSIVLDGGSLIVTGASPDKAGLAVLEEFRRALRPELRVELATVPGAVPGLSESAFRAALFDLLRLDLGTASFSKAGIGLSGITCRPLIRDEVRSGALARAGGTAEVRVSLRQTGCTRGPAAICQNRLDELSRRNPVLFVQGAAATGLDAATERFVDEAVAILDGCPDSHVVIEGHANNDGAERGFDNRDLSERRARRLRDELAGRGIAAERLGVRAFGADRPLAAGDTPEAKALNRRLQFTVMR